VNIASWLRQLGLEQYTEAFRANAIDEKVLPQLTAEDINELGVQLIGHRRKLLSAIAELRVSDAAYMENQQFEQSYLPAQRSADSTSGESPSGAERRQLTVMFSDLVGSTALSTRLDAEDLREIIATYQRCCAEVIREFGGYLAKYLGDGVLAYFGYPQAHEDDAERAVRAGLVLIQRVGCFGFAIGKVDVRVGIATGQVIVGDLIGDGEAREHDVIGQTPNLAARLQAKAAPNTVLISESTRRLIGDLFDFDDVMSVKLKGFQNHLQVWKPLRPIGVKSRFEALRAPSLTPLVGREEELELLMRRWTRAKSGNGQVVLISGEAGIGKSRIAAAFEERLQPFEHARVRLSASPQHRDSTLHPVIGHLERAAEFAHNDSPETKLEKLQRFLSRSEQSSAETTALFAELLSLPAAVPLDPHTKRELTLRALTWLFEALAYKSPVLLVVEDMHWLDSTSRDLLDSIVERTPKLPVICVVTSRPEASPTWVAQAHVTALSLNRFDEQHTVALIKKVADNRSLASEIIQRIVTRTDGIPLFIEEMTKSLLESGMLRAEEDHYVLDPSLPQLAIPSSLHALLLSRLDRLEGAKEVAQVAAALGREFSFELLRAVSHITGDQLKEALSRLLAAGLIFRRGSAPRESFIFKHALVQDAAYSTLLRGPRRALHARVASIQEEQFPEIGDHQPEIVAHHYTEAGLPDNAIKYWRKAGELALRRSANVEAVQHLTHALALTPSLGDEALRRRQELAIYLVLGQAVRGIKGHAAPETLQMFTNARDRLDIEANAKQKMSILYGLFGVHFVRGEHAAAYEVAREAAALVPSGTPVEASAAANSLLGHVLWAMGKFTDARVHLEQALRTDHRGVRNEEDRRLAENHRVAVLSFLAHTLWALGYPEQAKCASTQAISRARDSGHVPLTAFALHGHAFLMIAFGADPEAHDLAADEAVTYCVEHEITTYEHWSRFYQGMVLAQRNDRLGTEIMRKAMVAAAQAHAGLFRPLHLCHLAHAEARFGGVEAGIELLERAIESAAETTELLFESELHRVKGELLFDIGRHDDAKIELDRAFAIAQHQGARLWELRAATSCARLLRGEGRISQAKEILTPIYDWFTEGFGTPDLKTAKMLIDELR
jgi:class 3 adenylate cyclase/tetratricopeptide (TPR) repeat protein